MRRALVRLLFALVGALAAVALIVLLWARDDGRHRGRVERGVTLAGRPVGGLTEDRLASAISDLGRRMASGPVRVTAPGGGFTTDVGSLGVRLDRQATTRAVLRVGRTGPLAGRVGTWLLSFVRDRTTRPLVTIDAGQAYRLVAAEDSGTRTPAVEPGIKVQRGSLTVVDGRPGHGIDPAEVIRALPAAAARGTPIVVTVGRGKVPPRFTRADAEAVVHQANEIIRGPLAVTAGTASAKVTAGMLRSWMMARPTDTGLQLGINAVRAVADLGRLLPRAGDPAVETTFTLVGGTPQIVPGRPGSGCCAAAAGDIVLGALRRRATDTIALSLKRVDPALTADVAAGLGIKERVSTFTTRHPCCAPRVQNIHRIADFVRGHVIKPGETFSVNAFVGARTTAKGFVVDHVIEDGKFAEAVGGGVSQFGTTTFNAAFFAGMEIPEYMAHTIYISRYPYGREATLNYPHPDLKIRNPSPYGVGIWTSFTGTSLTVSFYSTQWATSTQTGQTTAPRGPCTAVRTERTRTFGDQTSKVDYFSALYQPAEGVRCT